MLDSIGSAARIVHDYDDDDDDDDAVVAVAAVVVVHGEGSERMLGNGGSNSKKLQQRREKKSGNVEASESLKHGANRAAPYLYMYIYISLSLDLSRSGLCEEPQLQCKEAYSTRQRQRGDRAAEKESKTQE